MHIAIRQYLDTGRHGPIYSISRNLSANFNGRLGRVQSPIYVQHSRKNSSRPFSTDNARAKVIFSGIQSTGVPHLGNYLGALRQWVALQNNAAPGDDLIFCVVDLHAITVLQDAVQLRQWRRETLAILLAIGLDPHRCTLFYQSAVPEHAELMWILTCMSPMGSLSRMTQWKSKLALSEDASPLDSASVKTNLRLGLFSYPVLQAADILLYESTHVPVGEDQVQHLEFTRNCVDAMNALHGELLVRPQTLLSPAKKVMSLKEPHLKMSKSHVDPRSRIQLDDSPEQVSEKIRLALTDSIHGVTYDPSTRPGVSNLLDIVSFLSPSGQSASDIARNYSDFSMRALKDEVTSCILSSLSEIQHRYKRLIEDDDSHYLEDVAIEGSHKARAKASTTMAKVKESIGLI